MDLRFMSAPAAGDAVMLWGFALIGVAAAVLAVILIIRAHKNKK